MHALVEARRLEDAGRSLDAIQHLTRINRVARDASVEEHLVGLRHRAFPAVARRPVVDLPPPIASQPATPGLHETSAADLDPDVVREAMARQGCVMIRGLLPEAEASELADGIDAALDAYDSYDGSTASDGWYAPFEPQPGAYRVGGRRKWVRASGALWTADSPRMLFALTDLLETTGIGTLATEYLGERPALSANKCTLRRVPTTASPGWHQDGAFLGEDVRSLNLWLALGHCGVDAPGLDIVPRRLDGVVEAGTEGAIFDWSVAPDVVERVAADAPVVRPEFAPGDALLFDHLLLHSTAIEETMTRERHAMETWMFAPSAYPEGQIPLVY